jgi:hypothetical protein
MDSVSVRATGLGWLEPKETGAMKKLALQILGVVLGLICAPASGADDAAFSLGVSSGTLGVGPELGLRFSESLGARINAAWLDASANTDIDGIRYNGDLSLNNAGAMLDWYPFSGGFRLSAGGRWNGNQLDLARPSAPVVIGGTTFTPAQVGQLEGTVEVNSFAPALSLGFSGEMSPGLTLGLELGVLYQGPPKLSNLRARGGLLEGDPGLLAEVAAEEKQVEDKYDSYRLWPIAQLLVIYRF